MMRSSVITLDLMQKMQISIFTCVGTTAESGTCSYTMLSDDRRHDTATALLAIQKINDDIDENGPIYGASVHISDIAGVYLKNQFRSYKMRTNGALKKWIFSAPGHRKNACDGIGGVMKHAATVSQPSLPSGSHHSKYQ